MAIFKSDNPSNFEASLNAISSRVTSAMNEELLAVFKAEEIWQALQQMHSTKASGPEVYHASSTNSIGIL